MSLERFRPEPETLIFAALFCGTFAYIAAWPDFLGASDESHFLFRAQGILAGQVPYRDFFEFYTPLSFYLMALAFALFGAKLATAKIFMALLHALTVGLIFKASRRAGARRSLSVATSIVYLVMGPAAWPYASPHWIAACLLIALLYVLLSRPLEKKSLVRLGLLTGVLTATQQQMGVPIAIGISLALMTESLLDGSAGRSTSIIRLITTRLCLFGLPAIGLTLGFLFWVMASAGSIPMFEQLVLHPLTGYRTNIHTSWGNVGIFTSWLVPYTVPAVLRVLVPSLLAISCFRLIVAFRADERSAISTLPRQTIYLFFTTCAVLYYPDFIHLGFISGVVLVVAGETIEWGLAWIETRASRLRPGLLIAIPLIALAIGQLKSNSRALNEKFSFEEETEFGAVRFKSEKQRNLFREVRDELKGSQNHLLFCYPVYTSLYLLTGAHNPTKHILMLPNYLKAEAYQEVIQILDARRVRNIVLVSELVNLDADPMYAYIKYNYHCIDKNQNNNDNHNDRDCRLYRRNR